MAAKKKKKVVKKKCVVCLERPQSEWSLCEDCDWSYADAMTRNISSIRWAADEARWYEKERQKAARRKK